MTGMSEFEVAMGGCAVRGTAGQKIERFVKGLMAELERDGHTDTINRVEVYIDLDEYRAHWDASACGDV